MVIARGLEVSFQLHLQAAAQDEHFLINCYNTRSSHRL